MGNVISIQNEFNFKLEKPALFNDEDVNFKKYSKFKNVRDFNNQWSMIMTEYKKFFSREQLRVLTHIRRYAVVNAGVCNATYRTLNDTYKKAHGVGFSRDLWRAAVDKADAFGLLNKHGGKRMKMGRNSKTANVIIFNRYDEVKAYAIAKAAEEEEEIAMLLEKEYARMTPVMNYAFNARLWAENKAMKKAHEQAEKERQEQAQKELERKAEVAQKQSLYKKMLDYIKSSKKKSINVNEFMGIAYGSAKKLMQNANVSKEQAEEMAFNLFVKALATKEENLKKTYAALYSWLMKDNFEMLTGQKRQMSKTEIAKKQGKKVGVITKSFAESHSDPIKRAELLEVYEQQEKARQEENENNPILKAAQSHWQSIEEKRKQSDLEEAKRQERERKQLGLSEKEYLEYKRAEILAKLNG